MLSTEGGADPAKLRHRKQVLSSKAKLLSKLDGEIVKAVHEKELEEVEAADTVWERIIQLDSVQLSTRSRATRVVHKWLNHRATARSRMPSAIDGLFYFWSISLITAT